jgi:hypothetical protein
MHENPFSLLHGIGFADERESRETLKQRCGSQTGLDAGGDEDGFVGWTGSVFGIGTGAEPGDVVADFEVVDVAGAGSDDSAFCFAAEDLGLGRWVEAGAEIAGCESVFRACGFEGMGGDGMGRGKGGSTCQCS